uniref:Uncharacterized protein n=1 Tax=Arundo donax TaxID=35708 RepID=A0A0A9B2M2_ARUDO
MEDRVLAQSDCHIVVHLQLKWFSFLVLQLTEQARQPYSLTGGRRGGNVVCFA